MSDISYEEFKSELQDCATAIAQASQNLAAATQEYERTKAELLEKQGATTPQERSDLGQGVQAAKEQADGCRAAQASALETLTELVQAHPEHAKRASAELSEVEKSAQTSAPEASPFREAVSSAWQSLGEGVGKVVDAVTGDVAKHVIAIAMAATAALQEPAVIAHELEESLQGHRAGVEGPAVAGEETQQLQQPREERGSEHHQAPHHEPAWPQPQPDFLEGDEHGVVNAPPANDNAQPRAAANDNNPQPPDRPQAAAALPPLAVNDSPQPARAPVHLEVVPPPPPPPPPPVEPEADRARSR